jgi:hypothetical protein
MFVSAGFSVEELRKGGGDGTGEDTSIGEAGRECKQQTNTDMQMHVRMQWHSDMKSAGICMRSAGICDNMNSAAMVDSSRLGARWERIIRAMDHPSRGSSEPWIIRVVDHPSRGSSESWIIRVVESLMARPVGRALVVFLARGWVRLWKVARA